MTTRLPHLHLSWSVALGGLGAAGPPLVGLGLWTAGVRRSSRGDAVVVWLAIHRGTLCLANGEASSHGRPRQRPWRWSQVWSAFPNDRVVWLLTEQPANAASDLTADQLCLNHQVEHPSDPPM
jgi:hypothetical protein